MNAGSCATCQQPLQLLSDGNGVLVEMCGCGLRRRRYPVTIIDFFQGGGLQTASKSFSTAPEIRRPFSYAAAQRVRER